MHIPDGFVDVPVAVVTGAVSLGVVAVAVRKTGKELGERTIPLLGVTAAFIFAAQMLNFPVAAGHQRPLPGSAAGRGVSWGPGRRRSPSPWS